MAAAVNKHVYVMVNKRFTDSIRVSYARTETVDDVADIKHPIVREGLKMLDLKGGLEITTVADVPANSGLGNSGSFSVGLLHALHAYKREAVGLQELAEEACRLEIDLLKEPVGKQDQYMAAFGGIKCLTFEKDGTVNVEPLALPAGTLDELEKNLLFFYTGITRRAAEILPEQKEACERNDRQVTESLHLIKEIGYQTREALQSGDVRRFGALLDEHWRVKRTLSGKVSNSAIDRWYETARANGAIGGKIMGAGGGGFFMFYAHEKNSLRQALEKEGLREIGLCFEPGGSKVIADF
jgi:D-glycero-alpha-D-manno-heptose-7-phosphate kinase